jgi:hypothetical protein
LNVSARGAWAGIAGVFAIAAIAAGDGAEHPGQPHVVGERWESWLPAPELNSSAGLTENTTRRSKDSSGAEVRLVAAPLGRNERNFWPVVFRKFMCLPRSSRGTCHPQKGNAPAIRSNKSAIFLSAAEKLPGIPVVAASKPTPQWGQEKA